MQIKVQFTEFNDGLNYIIGEKIFNKTADKQEIETFITQATDVFKQTRSGIVSCIIFQRESENNPWGIPVNTKTLNNEIV